MQDVFTEVFRDGMQCGLAGFDDRTTGKGRVDDSDRMFGESVGCGGFATANATGQTDKI